MMDIFEIAMNSVHQSLAGAEVNDVRRDMLREGRIEDEQKRTLRPKG